MNRKTYLPILMICMLGLFSMAGGSGDAHAAPPPERGSYDAYPPFMANTPPPLVMLVMGRNHKLFYEAYNDASDLNEDGKIDVGYKPDEIESYYGYFDSYKYYEYVGDRFEPRGPCVGANKKMAPGGPYWSGDFLNYLTMSRMDTIRKVLYGGKRYVDTPTETVLERAYIPQDAHSWGKEYTSVAHDGYDIADYSPLAEPESTPVQTRHLFASTSLHDPTNANYEPLLRILNDSVYRIWEWVSIERPVAGEKCLHGGTGPDCATSAASSWMIVPDSTIAGISDVRQFFFDTSGIISSHPADHTAFNQLLLDVFGGDITSPTVVPDGIVPDLATIDGSGNPFGANDYYLSVALGTLNIHKDGDYTFGVDGDDAVELLIDLNGNGDFEDDGGPVVGWYSGHGECNNAVSCIESHSGTVFLAAGSYNFQYRQEEMTGSDSYYLRWKVGVASAIDDKVVRVVVADPAMPETNCKEYNSSTGTRTLKPIGLLQRHGESGNMLFGLMSGSYTLNMSGGVLRKNIGPIDDEIDPETGVFITSGDPGIIGTIDRFRISEFRFPDSWPSRKYEYDGGWETQKYMTQGQFPDWGNPVGEMMYETLRYFAGESPTGEFDNGTMADDTALGLSSAAWSDPYAPGANPECAKPFMLVLSDINPTFDSDQLPGSAFDSFSGSLGTLDVEGLADTISAAEGISGDYYIGEQASAPDSACTSKKISGLGDIRGLCPEEPTKQGSYYSAAVAYYGRIADINHSAPENQFVQSYMVGLASPLPRIEIPVGNTAITLVPFAKSVGGSSINAAQGAFQPTNTIVDFYVETIDADNPTYGKFRINFEDVEQGADHDMDAIVAYTYQVYDSADNPAVTMADGSNNGAYVTITLDSPYAAGGIVQHMGYIISGTNDDGTYLEVRDEDTAPGTDVDYYLDTPNTTDDLPLHTVRKFYPGDKPAATLLENPLWYAAKWGAFYDKNGNNIPDLQEEWDKDLDGVPDTYYYVVNPLKLEQQLNKSFADINARTSSGTAAAVVANNSEGQGTMIQAFFKPQFFAPDKDDPLSFVGYLKSLWVDQFGHLREDSNHDFKYNYDTDKIVEYGTDDNGNAFVHRYTQHYHYEGDNQYDAECVISSCTTTFETIAIEDIETLFAAGSMLHSRPADDRTIFTFIDGNGLDDDGDGDYDESGEIEGADVVGQVTSPFSDIYNDSTGQLVAFSTAAGGAVDRIKPFLGLSDDASFGYLETGGPDHDTRVQNLINFIRGVDSAGLTGAPNTRDRTFDGNVWKLGDIVRSTPVSVAGAVENYAVIYSDESYLTYIRKYADRENVVYAGANDGMLHAFSHGRYTFDETNNIYGYEAVDGTPIGSELWAYIPQALLPHLKWLADPDYGHSFYVDLKPKVFDARVFPVDDDHPQGWGTLLLVGLGNGGKDIWAEGDFDQNSATGDVRREFHPTYVCMDITNPRTPRLLWERSYENLGMSANFPSVVQVGAQYSSNTHQWSGGKWFLVFGSGPFDPDPLSKKPFYGYSEQPGYVFVADVLTGALERRFDTGVADTIMAAPAGLDMAADDGYGPVQGLTYNVDALYMGSASYDATLADKWFGNIFKINTRVGSEPSDDPDDWDMSVLFNSDRPITAAPSLTVDQMDNVWVLFGTGRFQEMSDRETTEQNYIYGLKDPYFNSQYDSTDDAGNPNAQYNGRGDYYHDNSQERTLVRSDLFYSNPYLSYDTVGTIAPQAGAQRSDIDNWDLLLDVVRNIDSNSDYFDGWYRELDPPVAVGGASERVISKPAILSGVLFVPVYIPDSDQCGFGGSAVTYGVYFETGTPLWRHIFYDPANAEGGSVRYRGETMQNAGPPPPTVSVHIGRESGAKLFTQTGTGPVLESSVAIDEIKSDIEYWGELDEWTNIDPDASPTGP